MKRFAAIGLLLLTPILSCSMGQNPAQPDADLNRMKRQPKAQAFGENRFFEDSRVMRHPPEGTIARGVLLPADPMKTGKEFGTYLKDNPLPVTEDFLKRGQDRHDIYCASCHGVLGDGKSLIAGNMKSIKPPSFHSDRIRAFPDGRLYQVIHEGYGIMPSYAARLSVEDRWAIVAYVRALQLSQGVPFEELPADLQAEFKEQVQ